jgi:DNA-binding NarL/FixJ family response regulator
MQKKWRVVLVEDHILLRAGLRALLSQDPDIEVVGEADNGRDAIRLIGQLAPHLVLTDLSMPGCNGLEATVDIKRRYPDVKVLVLTIHKADEYIHASLKAGADGYILKVATHDELRIAIRTVLAGKIYLSPDIAEEVIGRYLGGHEKAAAKTTLDTLTHRERQVLQLVAEGHSNKYIASYLCLSVKTVDKHRGNLMKKLDVHNVAGLTTFAVSKGLVSGLANDDRGLVGA